LPAAYIKYRREIVKKVIYGINDAAKALLIGVIAGIVIEIVFTLIGLIAHRGSWIDALIVGRNAEISAGAIGLLISSGIFLKRDSLRPLKDQEGWKRNFKALNYGYVLLLLFIGMLIIGGILDLVLYKLKFRG
jgi:hypothetical protein